MSLRRQFLTAAAGLLPPLPALAQKFGSSQGRRQKQDTNQVLHLRRFDIMDQHGFEEPVPAASLLAPADWRIQGGVTWGGGACLTDLVSAHALLSSPDGRHAFEILPGKLWTWSLDPFVVQVARQQAALRQSCPAAPPMPAAQALQQIILPSFRPDAQLLGTEPDPAAAAALHEEMAPLANIRPESDLRTDAARLRLAWQGSEEWLAGGVAVISYAALSPTAAGQGHMGYTRNADISLQNLYAFRAPAGGLEAAQPLLATMLTSIRKNPAWEAAMSQVVLNIAQIVQRGVMERARIWREAQQHISDIQRQSWQYRQETQDRVARAFSQVIRGVETYVDPSGNQVELTAGYRRAWSNGLGEYIVSNDGFFEPGRSLRGNWTELHHGQP